MSIDLNWAALTTGPDGLALAETFKDFIHARFQTVALPRFIKSVTVHAFEFGSVPPELEIRDICDPLPDFYEKNEEDDDGSDDSSSSGNEGAAHLDRQQQQHQRQQWTAFQKRGEEKSQSRGLSAIDTRLAGLRGAGTGTGPGSPEVALGSPFLGASTPGIPGGTSNLSYFQSHLAPGRSGTHTPLAAVAGAQGFHNGWFEYGGSGSGIAGRRDSYFDGARHRRTLSAESIGDEDGRVLREKHSVSTLAASSSTTRPHTQDGVLSEGEEIAGEGTGDGDGEGEGRTRRFREARVEDLQTVFRVRYSGDVRLSLTAEILLDYPMPSFVGIPVKLNITGLSFDGVAVLAYIRKRAHFCFLSPEDAVAAIGAEGDQGQEGGSGLKMGGLLQQIKVESEIGQRENGKQVLKNVGKVEKFVLEQVRRIFEDEFVYPSFWTFLV